MNALEWLKERQRQSLENQALFNATPFEQTAHGFKARNYKQPEVKNKLVQKRGEDTLTKEWVSPYPQRENTLNISALPNNRVPPMPPGGEWARTTGMWDVPAKTQLSHADISNLRAMREAEVTPTPPQQLRPTGPSEQYWNLRNLSGGYARQPRATIPQPRSTMPEAVRASEGPSMEVLPGESIEEARLRIFGRGSPESTPRETWGGDLNLTMPQHPRTRRWIQDPASILNIGNLIKKMGGTIQGIDDRQERNRIRRLMEHRTTNPYYRSGGRY